MPPVLFCIAKDSRDHSPEVYREVVLPMFATIDPAPKVRVVQWGAGVHTYQKAEDGLPLGIAPPVIEFYVRAIQEGYFLSTVGSILNRRSRTMSLRCATDSERDRAGASARAR